MKKRVAAALLFLLMLAAGTIIAVSQFDYAFQDRDAIMAASTIQHPAGTDELGRDRLVRVAAALLIGLVGATVAAAITSAIAGVVGMAAAFSPPFLSGALLFLSDVFLSLPWLFLLMMARSLLPLTASPLETAIATFFVLAALGWPACSRAVYRGATHLRTADWMVHGYTCGLRRRQLIRTHLVPHLSSLFIPQFLVCIPAFMVAEANLGALGLGVGEPVPSWGSMLLELGNTASLARSHWVYLPIVLLVVVLMIFELFMLGGETNA